MYAKDMNWDDDYTLENSNDTRRGMLQLAMYAMHVGTGNSLFCKTIKVATVKQYVRAAATFLGLFGDKTRDYRKELPTDTKTAPILNSVFVELGRWEVVENRREPFTLEMLHDIQETITTTAQTEDSLMAAAADWFECGLFLGLRLSEWAQDTPGKNIEAYQRDFRQQSRAFNMSDIRFESNTRARLTAQQVLENNLDDSIVKCWVKFRTQKNGHNGEERLFTRNEKVGGKCLIRPMLNILRRFARILGTKDTHTPLALYRERGDKPPKFITASDIERLMRQSAARVYSLDPVKDFTALQKWSAHSLRVGGCVILHAMGYTETMIQWLLRWRSNAFMLYLRNVAIISTRHHQTLDTAASMPNFL